MHAQPDGRYEPVTQYLSFNSAYRWENAAILTVRLSYNCLLRCHELSV